MFNSKGFQAALRGGFLAAFARNTRFGIRSSIVIKCPARSRPQSFQRHEIDKRPQQLRHVILRGDKQINLHSFLTLEEMP